MSFKERQEERGREGLSETKRERERKKTDERLTSQVKVYGPSGAIYAPHL